jgi:osmoprotectant transport system substrate-binding protein
VLARVPGRRLAALVCAVGVVGVLAACSADDPDPSPGSDAVVVASFDFSESRLLGEIYAQALEQAGVPVRRELGLGSRELVLPALRQGLVDVVPEYLGTALAAVSPPGEPPAAEVDSAHRRLQKALAAEGLRALRPAEAENTNGLAVTRTTAARLGLTTTSDLAPHAAELVVAGPSECPGRPFCLQGLESVYGLTFAEFSPYDAQTQRITALEEGVVDVAVVFTTDGLLAARDLVLLADDRNLQPAENVVPVVSEQAVARHGERVAEALDAVSARLDSAALTFLNWRVEVAGADVEGEARGWLQRQRLVPR